MLKWRAFYLVPLSLLLAGVVACNNDETASLMMGPMRSRPNQGSLRRNRKNLNLLPLR